MPVNANANSPTSQKGPWLRTWAQSLLTPERLFFAALVGSIVSYFVHLRGVLAPGPAQTSIFASSSIPFFNHMIVSFYCTLLAWFGGGRFDDFVRRHPRVIVWGIIISTMATGVQQWFFPNF